MHVQIDYIMLQKKRNTKNASLKKGDPVQLPILVAQQRKNTLGK